MGLLKEYLIDSLLTAKEEGAINFRYKKGDYKFDVTVNELGIGYDYSFNTNNFTVSFTPKVSGKHKVIIAVSDSNDNFVNWIEETVYVSNTKESDIDNIEVMNREGLSWKSRIIQAKCG